MAKIKKNNKKIIFNSDSLIEYAGYICGSIIGFIIFVLIVH